MPHFDNVRRSDGRVAKGHLAGVTNWPGLLASNSTRIVTRGKVEIAIMVDSLNSPAARTSTASILTAGLPPGGKVNVRPSSVGR